MIEIANFQTIGKRENQEDYFATIELENGVLALLADGMGGHERGEVASKLSIKSFIECFKSNFKKVNSLELLKFSLYQANSEVSRYKELNKIDLGTTLIALFAKENSFEWVSVGDSLLYLYRDRELLKLNQKHTLSEELKEFDRELNQDMLTSAIYGEEISKIDLNQKDFKIDDILILASDGLDSLSESEIVDSLNQKSQLQNISEDILTKVNQKNYEHQDNSTILMLKKES